MIIESILEQRAVKKTGAHPSSPAYWIQKLLTGAGGGTSTAAGINIDHDNVLTFSAVWNAVNIISGAVGFLPMIVYRRREDGGRERAPQHRVYQLMHDRPNPYMDALVFRETLTAHALTWGNGYAEIEWDGGMRPVALWPLLPDRMKVKVDGNEVIYQYTTKDGKQYRLLPEDVLHIKGLGFDGLKGYSVIQYAAEGIAAGMAAERFGAAFFGNGAIPGGVLEHPKVLSNTARRNLRDSWEERHKGLDQAHRVAILEEGMTYKQIGIPARDAQLLETRRFSISDVARWFDIPPHMLKDLTRSTYSNIEQQGIEFVTWTLAKWLRRWELETNWKLFSNQQYGYYYAEFVVDALLRGDTNSRYEAYAKAINSGWMKPNEVRLRENLNPDPAIEGFRQPVNIITIGTGAQAPAAGGDESEDERQRAFARLLRETWRRIITKEVKALRKALKRDSDFLTYVRNFYAKQAEYATQVLEPVLSACYGRQIDPAVEVVAYITDGLRAMEKCFAEGNGNAVQAAENLLDEWENERVEKLATQTMLHIRR